MEILNHLRVEYLVGEHESIVRGRHEHLKTSDSWEFTYVPKHLEGIIRLTLYGIGCQVL